MLTRLGEKFTDIFKRFMPDAFVFALILTLIVASSAYFWLNSSLLQIIESWYQGFWLLLEFGMQMVLLIITGYSIALSPIAKKGIDFLAKYIKTPGQVYFFVVLIGTLLCMVSWGWIIITAILARELAQRVSGLNYPYLIACVYFSFIGWVTGFSSSIPLLLNTPKNYLIETGVLDQIISTDYTLGSSLNIAMILMFLIITPLLMLFFAPKKMSSEHKSQSGKNELGRMLITNNDSQDESIEDEAEKMKLPFNALSDKLNGSIILQWIIALMGLGYIVFHFWTKGLDLNLNIMIFIFLILGLFLHKTPIRYSLSMKKASGNVSGILFQFPFYAGIMGIMIHTGLGEKLAIWLASVATIDTYPLYSFLAGGIVNFAIPSAGGEFAVIGPSVIQAVRDIGHGLPQETITAMTSRAALSMAYGESLTNALQPFFLLLILPIMGSGTKIQARDIMGYLVLPFIIFFILQALMVTYWPL